MNDDSEGSVAGVGFTKASDHSGAPHVLSPLAASGRSLRVVGWRLPRAVTGDRYHCYESGTHCLCGRWKETELLREAEERRPIVCADAMRCVLRWRQLHEPQQRFYVRGKCEGSAAR